MRLLFQLTILFTVSISGFYSAKSCPANPDKLYNRQQVLEEFASILDDSIPEYFIRPPGFYVIENENAGGFFVYDLTDPSNEDYGGASTCINFIDDHIYHFTANDLYSSRSHIAILEKGKIKIFKSINCHNSEDTLDDVLAYLNKKLKNNKLKNDVITRVKNYRRYGFYITDDSKMARCEDYTQTPENPDALYNRRNVLLEFDRILFDSNPRILKEYRNIFSVQNERAVGFFVYDLTDPSNKQTSLTERVNFVNNHVYHFAWIDLPFSLSNIAVLEDGKLKVFKAINCEGKGDSLKNVVTYLNDKLKNDKNKSEIIKRVKNYRKYGIYTSFNGISTPQCNQIETNDSKASMQKLE